MRHVIVSQHWGVLATAPRGSLVAMKNGHVTYSDGLMVVNTSGIVVTADGHAWIIAVYSFRNASFTAGTRLDAAIAAALSAALVART